MSFNLSEVPQKLSVGNELLDEMESEVAMRMLCGTILVMLAMVGGTALAACEEPLSVLASRYADAATAGCGISKAAAFAASQNPDGS